MLARQQALEAGQAGHASPSVDGAAQPGGSASKVTGSGPKGGGIGGVGIGGAEGGRKGVKGGGAGKAVTPQPAPQPLLKKATTQPQASSAAGPPSVGTAPNVASSPSSTSASPSETAMQAMNASLYRLAIEAAQVVKQVSLSQLFDSITSGMN